MGVQGVLVAGLMKHCFQQAVMRSPDRNSPDARMAVLVSDECQFTLDPERDLNYTSVCRSYRAPMVYLSQSKTMLEAVAGEKDKKQVEAVLANLSTHVYLANGDPATQEYVQTRAGKSLRWRRNISSGSSSSESTPAWLAGGDNENAGMSEQLDFVVQGSELADLTLPGREKGFRCDGLIYKAGRRWKANDQLVLRCSFSRDAS